MTSETLVFYHISRDAVQSRHPEDVGSVDLRNVGIYHNITRRHNPEDLGFEFSSP
jgi:hypothetical protein